MKTTLSNACAILLLTLLLAIASPARAHRLDEYLQAATISVEAGRVGAQMRLTPGVAVFPAVFKGMDANGDGVLSGVEQRAYAERVLGDLSLAVDGERLRPLLLSWKFAPVTEMKEGRGEIEIAFRADVPRRVRPHTLIFENHHQSKIAVYLVNCLVPSDPNIQVTAQRRNYGQSRYELDYIQGGIEAAGSSPSNAKGQSGMATRRQDAGAWLGVIALALAAPLAWQWQRARARNGTAAQEGRGV